MKNFCHSCGLATSLSFGHDLKQVHHSLKFAKLVPGDALHILRVRGRAIWKGIYFPDIGIKNGINVHNFGIRNGTDFQDLQGMKCKVGYTFPKKFV